MQGPRTLDTERLFNSIAPTYDSLNHWLSLGVDKSWRRRSLRWIVDPSAPQQILDIACGTGDYSIAIARRAHPDTVVTGVDLTEAMLQVMRFSGKSAKRLSGCSPADIITATAVMSSWS